jgi:hypothetical protein
MPAMTKIMLLAALAIAAGGLAACGGDGGGDVRTVTVTEADPSAQETPTSAPVPGDPILIQTRVTNARLHKAHVTAPSVFGESAFCPGGKATGGSDGPTIHTIFHCRGGTLEIKYAPVQPSDVQGSPWEIVRGTGSFKGLQGGGSMVDIFEKDNPDSGREVFTGTAGK